MQPADVRYLEQRAERAKSLEPRVLESNQKFYEQFSQEQLELVVKVYNHVIRRANWQGRNYTVKEDLNPEETKRGLAEELTRFQADVDNLRE